MPEVSAAGVAVVVADVVSAAVEGASPLTDFLDFFFLVCSIQVSKNEIMITKFKRSYLLPSPQRLETVKEPNIFKQVREEPQTRRHDKHRDAEQNQTEDRHGEEQS